MKRRFSQTIRVAPECRRVVCDDGLHADEVKQAIRSSVLSLAVNHYDWDGEGGLPIRPDSSDSITQQFTGPFGPNLNKIPIPSMELNPDGTVSMKFESMHRKLELEFPCFHVIFYRKTYPDKVTTITGDIRALYGDNDEMDKLFDWLMCRGK